MPSTDPVVVVDASITVKACLGTGFASLLRHGRLIAPPLMWSEGTAILRESAFRGEITSSAGKVGLERSIDAPVERVRPPDLHRNATSIAQRLGWARTYDAEYVALAQSLDAPLVTVDTRLATRTRRCSTHSDHRPHAP